MKKSWIQIKNVWLIAAAWMFLSSCSNTETGGPQIIMMKGSYSQSLMFGGAKRIIGLDPLTDQKNIDIRFNHFVLYGDVSQNDELLCADIGKGVGDFGGQIILLNQKGKMIKSTTALPNPGKIRLIGERIFSDSVGYYEDGYTAYMLFDLKTFEKVHEDKTLSHFVANDRSWIYSDHAYIGVRPNEAIEGRRSEIRKLDLKTYVDEKVLSFTDRHPYYYFNTAIAGKYLVIAYIQACEIEVFDINTGTSVACIDLKESIPQLMNDPHLVVSGTTIDSSYRLERPIEVNGVMYFHLMPNSPDAFYQAIIHLNATTWKVEKIVPLEQNYILSAIDLSYVKNGKAYYCDHRDIFIYDVNNGSFLKEISMEK